MNARGIPPARERKILTPPPLRLTPPPPVDRQTPVKTVPSRRTTYAGGNNIFEIGGLENIQTKTRCTAFVITHCFGSDVADTDGSASDAAGCESTAGDSSEEGGISAFCQSSPSSTITPIIVPSFTSLESSGFCKQCKRWWQTSDLGRDFFKTWKCFSLI